MRSHLSEEEISNWIAGKAGGGADLHIRNCPECAAEVEHTRQALLLFRDSGYQCAEYWLKHPPAQRSHKWVIGVASVAASLIAAVILLHKPEPPAPRTQEIFMKIPYVVPPAPYERTEVVRMDVPVAALIAAGFRMEAPAADSVSADVLIGQDGRPLAVAFPENKQ